MPFARSIGTSARLAASLESAIMGRFSLAQIASNLRPAAAKPALPVWGVDSRRRWRREFSTGLVARHTHLTPPKPGEELHVTFIDKDGEKHTFEVAAGDNLLDIAQEHDMDMEGACGGSAACSTCHVIVEDEAMYEKIPEPDDDENDMLDLAFGLTETSRLGCQVHMSKKIDGITVRLPSMTRNLQSSDFSKK
ncbi:mitochondrial matrix iron-sulfur protein [Rhizina undulata]